LRENRETLLSTDESTAVILEPIGEGKIRVRTSTWDQEVVILADQALEVRGDGKVAAGGAGAAAAGSIWTTARKEGLLESAHRLVGLIELLPAK
jgi:hypothetical protein